MNTDTDFVIIDSTAPVRRPGRLPFRGVETPTGHAPGQLRVIAREGGGQ